MKEELERDIGHEDLVEVERINSNTIKEAMDKVKANKVFLKRP